MDMGPSSGLALHKGRSRKSLKAAEDRAEAKVKKAVRAACVERDGACRIATPLGHDVLQTYPVLLTMCDGPSQWAHMHTHRRSQTRGQDPEQRHTTAASLMLCQRHHDQYDGRQRPRLLITRLSHKGANGPLKFRRGKA